jgi:hypothetical protein
MAEEQAFSRTFLPNFMQRALLLLEIYTIMLLFIEKLDVFHPNITHFTKTQTFAPDTYQPPPNTIYGLQGHHVGQPMHHIAASQHVS